MPYTSHTIYIGTRSTTVGITIRPTPSLTLRELDTFIAELSEIRNEMSHRIALLHEEGQWTTNPTT